MTTGAGLYRYLLGDVVEVCGFHDRTPRIRFVRKYGAASNLTGENLVEDHVNRAVGDALAALGVDATYFTVAPRLGADPPGYVLYFEPRDAAQHGLEALRKRVDE